MKSVCVFCGASFNGDAIVKQTVEQLAEVLVNRQITLIFGGANIGIMGMLANAVLNGGGEVIGVLPRFLADREIANTKLSQLHLVETMHQRKQKMIDLCDAIITLPGGIGTMDEFFEALTWRQLNLHQHLMGLLNVNGFYDLLLNQLDTMVANGYLNEVTRKLIITSSDPVELINLIRF